jgi:hypothetical protein
MLAREVHGFRTLTSYCFPLGFQLIDLLLQPVTLCGRPTAPTKLIPERKSRGISTG